MCPLELATVYSVPSALVSGSAWLHTAFPLLCRASMQRKQWLVCQCGFGVSGATRLAGRAASLRWPGWSTLVQLTLWSVVERVWPEMLQPVKPTGGCALSWKHISCIALHCKDVMGCEVARHAEGSEGRVAERGSEGIERRLVVFGVDLIARHYCGILLYTYAGRPAHQSTAQHSLAQDNTGQKQISAGEQLSSPRVPSGWKLSRQLRDGHSQLLPNTPAWQYKYADACTCGAVTSRLYPPMCQVASCTHSALKPTWPKKRESLQKIPAARAVGLLLCALAAR